MSDHLLSLAAGVVTELAADPATFVEAAAAGGWPACGVWFDPASWTDDTTREVRRRLDDTGIQPVDMEVIRIGSGEDHGERLVDAAAEVGASNILCISSLPDPAATADRLGELSRRAAPAGIRVCIEFMVFTTVKTLADAVTVVEQTGETNAGILVDALHVFRSGTTLAQVAAADPALFPYAQWCDAPAEPPGTETRDYITDALDDRSAPGEGALPIAAFPALFDASVPMSMEVRSKALRDGFPDPTERAAHLLKACQSALAKVN